MNHEEKVRALLESMEIAASCPDCGKLSLEIWTSTGLCPHCENKPTGAEEEQGAICLT